MPLHPDVLFFAATARFLDLSGVVLLVVALLLCTSAMDAGGHAVAVRRFRPGAALCGIAAAGLILRAILLSGGPPALPALAVALAGGAMLWRRARSGRMPASLAGVTQGASHDAQMAMLHRLASLARAERPRAANDCDTRVGACVRELALLSGLEPATATEWQAASAFHDVGRIALPVLPTGGGADAAAMDAAREAYDVLLRRAPVIGARLLADSGSPLLDLAAEMALGHEEWWDGSGYPTGLSRDQIPLPARVVAVAMRFDAMLAREPLTEWGLSLAIGGLQAEAGLRLDPVLVSRFLRRLGEAPCAWRQLLIRGAPGAPSAAPIPIFDVAGMAARAFPCVPLLP